MITNYVITSECMNCGLCAEKCPVSAIVEDEEKHVITDSCISCGSCAEICPVDAIRVIKIKQAG
ncbi:MAG: 4Fe-4S binding protein [Candidatus Cloacimonetes bacterium]|nr:4Fe-4S binding protein [Candidatus Cloacimonadota bacterium]